MDALNSKERDARRGVITLSNHISTLDDPVTWGILPTHYFFNTRTTRWVLGASDMMFTNPVLSTFFRNGQVIETFRGAGIFQPAVDFAIDKLNEGAWIHLFGEGKVNQPNVDKHESNILPHKLLRFKWGVGRIVMEAVKPPVIIPMWLSGFDKLMPEDRPSPYKFFPRRGANLSITFGKPIDDDNVKATLKRYKSSLPYRHNKPQFSTPDEKLAKSTKEGWLSEAVMEPEDPPVSLTEETDRTRSKLTGLLQQYVEALGQEVNKRT